jgi:hypothetical protein
MGSFAFALVVSLSLSTAHRLRSASYHSQPLSVAMEERVNQQNLYDIGDGPGHAPSKEGRREG